MLATSERDVVWAVRAAAREDRRVGVRSGGHSWYGNGLRNGGWLVDLSRLTAVSVNPAAMTAVAGPGVTGRALDAALIEHGLFFPVGHCGSVGLGGFVLGGGYGWNSRALGPACLSLRAVDVVLADGEVVHADSHHHPELLWAARGSGPGFFGVVTRFHLRLSRRPAMARATHVYPLAAHDDVLRWGLELLPRLPAEVELSARVGHSNLVGERAVTLTALAFPPPGSAAGPGQLLAVLDTCPWASRALSRTTVPVERLPDLHDRGDGPALRWDVDGIWTAAPAAEIIPAARAAGLGEPRGPHGFVLWMLWGHHSVREDACWSVQAPLYLSPNAGWEAPGEDLLNLRWVDHALRSLAGHSRGVQFSDANLAARPGAGLSQENARRLETLRRRYDPDDRFFSYMRSEAG